MRISLLFCSPVVQGVLPAVDHGRGGAEALGKSVKLFLCLVVFLFFLFVCVDAQKANCRVTGIVFFSLSASNCGSCGEKRGAPCAKCEKCRFQASNLLGGHFVCRNGRRVETQPGRNDRASTQSSREAEVGNVSRNQVHIVVTA